MLKRILVAASLALSLAACGGGGGSSGSTASATPVPVSATVAGLTGGSLVLADGTDTATVTANGTYSFKTKLAVGTTYNVTVSTQPTGETCTVTGGSGTVSASSAIDVSINCTLNPSAVTTSTSTGFSVLATGSTRIAFLPVGSGVAALSLGSALTSTTAHALESPRSLAAGTTSTIALPFAPVSCAVDGSALKAVCINLSTAQIAVLDLSTFVKTLNLADVAVQTVTLSDISSLPTKYFSGDSCLVCGVVIVPNATTPADAQIVISASDGYHVYSYPAAGATTATATKVYNIPISENLAADVANDRLIAPDYGSTSSAGTHVVNIVDLKTGNVYGWTQPACSSLSDSTQQSLCNSFSMDSIDSSAIDPVTGVLVLQSESGAEVAELDLSQATFTAGTGTAAGTFTAPYQYASMNNTAYGEMSGSLISGVGDDLFSGSEFTSDATISVAQLPSAGGSGGVFPATPAMNPVYVDLTTLLSSMGSSAPCTSFSGAYDPHNEAATVNIYGVQYGLYGSDLNNCVAVVNLGALAAEPRDTVNTNQVASTVNLTSTGVVQFFAVP